MKLFKDMDEPELRLFFTDLVDTIKSNLPGDAEGFVVVVAADDKMCQYAGTIEREDAVGFLRETAVRLERRNTIER